VATWNTAAAGGALLAGVALVALLTALTSQRAGEVLVLRALGIAATPQSRMRAVETGLVVVLATVLGIAGGMLLAALLVPSLVERAVPAAQLTPALALDPWPLVIAALVVAAAWAGSAYGAALAVRRQATSTRLEEAAA
jgi:ABC-type antimicrobial peptide transport system permease subunit